MKTQHSVAKRIQPAPLPLRYFFFTAGIIATIAYRITPFLNPLAVKISWYVGTVGFILYFAHRAHIENKRAKLVRDYSLINVVAKSDIGAEEKSAISYLVKTSLTSTAKFNSLFILISSIFALIASIVVDLHLF